MKTQPTMQILKYELYLSLDKTKVIIKMFLHHPPSDSNHNYQNLSFPCFLKDTYISLAGVAQWLSIDP